MEQDSHYHRQPGVSPIRITVYPKRRLSDLPPGLRTIPAEKPLQLPTDFAATYVDFFRHGRLAPMTSFRHVVDESGAEVSAESTTKPSPLPGSIRIEIPSVVEGETDTIGA